MPSGGFKIVNTCPQTLIVNSILFGTTDKGVVPGLKLQWQLGSQPPFLMAMNEGMVTNANPGTLRLTLSQPFAIEPGQTGFFSLSAVLAGNAPLNASATQSVKEVVAVRSSKVVAISNLPANLGTVKVTVRVPTRTATPTPTPLACGALTVLAKGSASGAGGAAVQSGGFKIVNGCGRPMTISGLSIGLTDVNVVSFIQVGVSFGSPASLASLASNQNGSIVNASPGVVPLTFTTPLQVPKGQTVFFGVAATLKTNASLGAPSTQSVQSVTATAGGKAAGVTNLPATLGTVSRR